MASPPPFEICGDLDLEDDDPATAARRNSNPPPPPEAHARKVKPAGRRRRRLCKFSAADIIYNILDDLTTRLDSLSVDRPKARAKPQVAPLHCAITDPDAGHYESAASSLGSTPDEAAKGADVDADGDPLPLEVSSSDEAAVRAQVALCSALQGN